MFLSKDLKTLVETFLNVLFGIILPRVPFKMILKTSHFFYKFPNICQSVNLRVLYVELKNAALKTNISCNLPNWKIHR